MASLCLYKHLLYFLVLTAITSEHDSDDNLMLSEHVFSSFQVSVDIYQHRLSQELLTEFNLNPETFSSSSSNVRAEVPQQPFAVLWKYH